MDPAALVTPPYVAGPLRLLPFRGLMLTPARVGNPTTGRAFARPYRDVSARLMRWQARGYVRHDAAPALYLHEYTSAGMTVRGLVGALDVSRRATRPADRAVLPHEGIHPAQADDLADRMAEMELNPAPILLVHRGSTRLREVLGTVVSGEPQHAFTDRSEQQHRIWAIRDEATLAVIAEELADSRALIADGHHRYAAYLRLQRRQAGHSDAPHRGAPRADVHHAGTPHAGTPHADTARPGAHPGTADAGAAHASRNPAQETGRGTVTTDYGLAMLVDQGATPLFLGPIHRTLAGTSLDHLRDAVLSVGLAFDEQSQAEAVAALSATRLAATDGRRWAVVTLDEDVREAAVETLHRRIVPALPHGPRALSYHHSVEDALAAARQDAISVLMPAPSVDLVIDIAEADRLLPEKATSFQPKPSLGVLIRSLRDAPPAPR